MKEEWKNTIVKWKAYFPFDGCFWKWSTAIIKSDGEFVPVTADGKDLVDENKFAEEVEGDDPPEGLHFYSLDDDKIEASCKEFCTDFRGDQRTVTAVLDKLLDLGYDAQGWCTQCGRMFHLHCYESFSDMIDLDSCFGDGGVGMFYDRLLCEDCAGEAWCVRCEGTTRRHDYGMMTFAQAFLVQWVEVCQDCAKWFLDEHEDWKSELEDLGNDIEADRDQCDKYLAIMSEHRPTESIERMRHMIDKDFRDRHRHQINEMRCKMEADVREAFPLSSNSEQNRVLEHDEYYY